MSKLPDLPKNRTIADLISDTRRPKPHPDTAWYKVGPSEPHGVNFTNSWLNSTLATSSPASWHLSDDGQVRLRGRVRGGTMGTIIFTLPPETRPEYDCFFSVDTDDINQLSLDQIKFRAWEQGDA